MEQVFANITNKTVLLVWNAQSSTRVQDTVSKLKEHIGEGHLSLEHVERLQLGIIVHSMLTLYLK